MHWFNSLARFQVDKGTAKAENRAVVISGDDEVVLYFAAKKAPSFQPSESDRMSSTEALTTSDKIQSPIAETYLL